MQEEAKPDTLMASLLPYNFSEEIELLNGFANRDRPPEILTSEMLN